MKLMSVYVKKEYLEAAKAEAGRRGVTLSDLIRELMDGAIEDGKKPPGKGGGNPSK